MLRSRRSSSSLEIRESTRSFLHSRDASLTWLFFSSNSNSAMIKSWLAREWTSRTDGKADTPNWSSGAPWDEKALEMGSSFLVLVRSLVVLNPDLPSPPTRSSPAPADIGLSFTGQSLNDTSHLTMSIDAPSGSLPSGGGGSGSGDPSAFYMPAQAGGPSSNPFDLPYPMDNLPPSFFSDVVWGGGSH